jgi:hypothetical protein
METCVYAARLSKAILPETRLGINLGETRYLNVHSPATLCARIFKSLPSSGKTLTAPLDRVKLLLQTRGGFARGTLKEAAKQGNVVDALLAIGKQEGLRGYWKGNLPQVKNFTI